MTLDTARLLANVNHRAQHLFANGYRAVEGDGFNVEVSNEEGTTYTVNTLFGTCTCPFWTSHEGHYPCKHILGLPKLLADQLVAGKTWKEVIGTPVSVTSVLRPDQDPEGNLDYGGGPSFDLIYTAPCLEAVFESRNVGRHDGHMCSVRLTCNETGLPWVDGWQDGDEHLRRMLDAMMSETEVPCACEV